MYIVSSNQLTQEPVSYLPWWLVSVTVFLNKPLLKKSLPIVIMMEMHHVTLRTSSVKEWNKDSKQFYVKYFFPFKCELKKNCNHKRIKIPSYG